MISVVLFDAAGTLFELRRSVGETYSAAAARHGVSLPAWRLDDAFQRVMRRASPMVFPEAAPSEACPNSNATGGATSFDKSSWRPTARPDFPKRTAAAAASTGSSMSCGASTRARAPGRCAKAAARRSPSCALRACDWGSPRTSTIALMYSLKNLKLLRFSKLLADRGPRGARSPRAASSRPPSHSWRRAPRTPATSATMRRSTALRQRRPVCASSMSPNSPPSDELPGRTQAT